MLLHPCDEKSVAVVQSHPDGMYPCYDVMKVTFYI